MTCPALTASPAQGLDLHLDTGPGGGELEIMPNLGAGGDLIHKSRTGDREESFTANMDHNVSND